MNFIHIYLRIVKNTYLFNDKTEYNRKGKIKYK